MLNSDPTLLLLCYCGSPVCSLSFYLLHVEDYLGISMDLQHCTVYPQWHVPFYLMQHTLKHVAKGVEGAESVIKNKSILR